LLESQYLPADTFFFGDSAVPAVDRLAVSIQLGFERCPLFGGTRHWRLFAGISRNAVSLDSTGVLVPD
jgi:hypothetical protein